MKVEMSTKRVFAFGYMIEYPENPFKKSYVYEEIRSSRPNLETAQTMNRARGKGSPNLLYVATDCYKITFTKKELFDAWSTINKKPVPASPCGVVAVEHLIKLLRKDKLLPKEEFYFGLVGHFPLYEYKHFPNSHEITLEIWLLNAFKPAPLTKSEQAKLDALNLRHKMETFNEMVVGGDIVKFMNDQGYCVQLVNHSIYFEKPRGFNKLVKDAFEYYLNNVVIKDLGCEVTIPKQKSSRSVKYTDTLCFVGDIKLKTEGEQ